MIFRFFSPWFFLLLIPALIALIVQLRRRPPSLIVSSVRHFTGDKGSFRPRLGWLQLPHFIEFIALCLLITALARPQKGREKFIDVSKGVDITFCLDVSGSMSFYDLEKTGTRQEIRRQIADGELKPRIEIAKEELSNFVEKRATDRLGLIVFATKPYQVCPQTIDKNLLIERIEKIDTDMLGQYNAGTGIAAPLASAVRRLKNAPAKRRIIILLTDGANNVDVDITPERAGELAKEFNITIYTIGIGSESAVRFGQDFFGRKILENAPGEFDKKLMENLASTTGGKYFHVENRQNFKEILDEIDKLEKVEIKRPRSVNYKELYPWFLYSGVGLFALSFLLSKTILLRIP